MPSTAIGPIGGLFAVGISLLVVACVFFLAYSVVWALKRKLGAQLAARVTGQAESGTGSWRFVATGLGGYFVLMVLLTFGGMYFVIQLLSKILQPGS